jgi:hypothetical protein
MKTKATLKGEIHNLELKDRILLELLIDIRDILEDLSRSTSFMSTR